MKPLKKFFNSPFVYNATQLLLAWAGGRAVFKKLETHFNTGPGGPVLDVGCGTGKYAKIFKEVDYTGIDISDDYLKYARQKYPFGRFINMDATKLSFPNDSFKFVFCVSTLHHLSDDQARSTLSEMKRVCQTGGTAYVIDNVYPSKFNFIGYFLFKLDRGRNQRTFEKMSNLLKPHGFEAVESQIPKSFPYRYAVFRYKK